MAEEQDTWYEPSLMAWHERSNAGVILTDFIRSKAYVLKLSSRTRMLSVGPGTGDMDLPIITQCCKQLKHYIGIEPNQKSITELKDKFNKEKQTLKDLKVEIVKDFFESWSGPDEPVDLILIGEVLYHIQDRKALYNKCRQWLAPGGVMVIVHGGEDLFYHVGKKFNVTHIGYTAPCIYRDLAEFGFKDVKDDTVPIVFDVRDRNRDLMNFLMQREGTDEEHTEVDKFLTEILPGGIEYQKLWVFWWTKP